MGPIEIALLCIGVLFILLICYMNWETRQLTITHHNFHSKKIQSALTFLHFTDLHLGRTGIKTEQIIKTIQENKSDFLVFTGDYFEQEDHIPRLLHLMDAIRSIYTKPIYFCYGNHDRKDGFQFNKELEEQTTKQLQERNITVLENQATIHKINDTALHIIGLSDARSNQADIPEVLNQIYTATPKDAMPTLLITHNSDILMQMPKGSVDFAVAGHTHGAQVRTPFELEVKVLHRKDILSSRKNIIRGDHRYNEIDLYINRGLGCTFLPIRFLSKPEIAVVRIIP